MAGKGSAVDHLLHNTDDHAIEDGKNACSRSLKCCHAKNIVILVLVLIVLLLGSILCVVWSNQNCNSDCAGQVQLQPYQRVAMETMPTVDDNEEDDSLNTICFPCANFGQNITSNDTGNIIKVVDKCKNMCCLHGAGNLRKLFVLMLNEYYRNTIGAKEIVLPNDTLSPTKKTTKPIDYGEMGAVDGTNGEPTPQTKSAPLISYWKQREDAAHMFLNHDLLNNSTKTSQRIPWDGEDYFKLSMAHHRVVYRPDKRSIQVRDYGLYFVYSSITFKAPEVSGNKQVYHTLLREHYLLPKTGQTLMLMNKYGGGKQSRGYYTSFLCGTFYLRNGDEIFVRVSNTSYVYNFYYSNYIGLYRL